MKNKIWKLILIIGILPYVIAVGYGIYSGITGFSGLCVLNCKDIHGIQAVVDSIIMYSYVFWYTYIIGLIMILISIWGIRIKKEK